MPAGVSKSLTSSEQAVLAALGEAYPKKVHLHQLAEKIEPPLERGALLQAVDGLYSRRLVECKPLRSNQGLEDAANILLSPEGTDCLRKLGSGEQVTAAVKVLNVLIASPSDVHAERDARSEEH